MVSPLVYNLLCRREFPEAVRRAFLAILAEYDLRDWTVINPFYILRCYNFDLDSEVTHAVTHMTNAGILEPGPRVNQWTTYRIRPEFIVSDRDIERLQRRAANRKAREAMGAKW